MSLVARPSCHGTVMSQPVPVEVSADPSVAAGDVGGGLVAIVLGVVATFVLVAVLVVVGTPGRAWQCDADLLECTTTLADGHQLRTSHLPSGRLAGATVGIDVGLRELTRAAAVRLLEQQGRVVPDPTVPAAGR